MRSNKKHMRENLNIDAAPPGGADQNLVGSVDICPLWTPMHLQCPTIPEVWMPV
jgi:hypothetical protein